MAPQQKPSIACASNPTRHGDVRAVPRASSAQAALQVFGYFSTRLEKSLSVPTADGNNVVKETQY